MLRARNLDNIYEKRTLRVLYDHSAIPYDARLASGFVRTGGAIEGTATTGITGGKAAILPGLVATKQVGEIVTVSGAYNATSRAFGLFANFVGGELDEIGTEDMVGVWRGQGLVCQILAPAFSGANSLSTLAAAETPGNTAAEEVYMNSNAKGQLEAAAAGAAAANSTARLISYDSADAITIELLV